MPRSDAVMKFLDATLILFHVEGVADAFGGTFTNWCRLHNIPRSTAYRHRARIIAEHCWTLRSRRPNTHPRATPFWVEVEIVRARLLLTFDNGADQIAARLVRVALDQNWAAEGWKIPSRATINNILKRLGLVVAAPKKRPKSSYKRFCYGRPRDCYQIDATVVKLADGTPVVVFEVLDDCTRTLVASLAAAAETAAGAIAAITRAFEKFGVPAIVLSDNGTAFTSRRTRGGISRFTRMVTDTGARLIHSTPFHPQTCGKVERHHRTFKQWLADRPAAADLVALQALCEEYQLWYNTQRWHSAVRKTPRQAWDSASALGGPTCLPVQRDASIHRLTVSSNGVLTLGGCGISVGRVRVGQQITVLRNGDHATAYDCDGDVIGHLTLDLSKRYQGKFRDAA